MNGARGLLIATAAAFIVGCSVGLMGGILFMRFGASGPHGGFMPGGLRGGPPPRFERRGPGLRGGLVGPTHEERMLPILVRELGLSPDQRERLVAQLDRARQHHAAVRESMQVWLDRELTPVQRERWKRVEAEMGPPRHRRESGERRPHDRP